MYSPLFVIAVICAYAALLFVVAQVSERRTRAGGANGPVIYSLALAVYCTSWTYYGSVGKATTDGMLFLTVYLGPTLALFLGSSVMRRMIRIKQVHRVTSIADFVSLRYGKSRAVAALATVILAVGIIPYVALQLKAVTGTFALLTARAEPSAAATPWLGPVVVAAMIGFTVVFGIRHIDPTERHPGMIVLLAAESLVKLVAFVAAGLCVTELVFGGLGGFIRRLGTALPQPLAFTHKESGGQLLTWGTWLLLSTGAFAFLPRQFHVGIVENSDERHVRTAMWLTPLYMLLINVFVFPCALAGMLTAKAGTSGDQFVLAVPMQAGRSALSLFVFLGGFSAAMGMIMVEAMTMATMVSNHLLLPLIESSRPLWPLRRQVLYIRWAAAAAFVVTGYLFASSLGRSRMLVNTGMLSFTAVVQFAPVIVGGLYWKRANKAGALLGLSVGFVVWFYTQLVPIFVKDGWLPSALLTAGPLGITALRPEALLYVSGLPPLPHGVLWTLAANVGFFVAGSVVFSASSEERRLAAEFVGACFIRSDSAEGNVASIDAVRKRRELEEIFGYYHPTAHAAALVERCFLIAGIAGKSQITVVEWAELHSAAERVLAGAVGAASAHAAMLKHDRVNAKDSNDLAAVYGRILASLNIAPTELRRRVDYHQEREQLLLRQAEELREKMLERDREIVERKRAEEALQRAHDELERRVLDRTRDLQEANDHLKKEIAEREKAEAAVIEAHEQLVDAAHRAGKAEIATNVLHNVGNVLNSVNVSAELCAAKVAESRLVNLPKLSAMLKEHEADLGEFLAADARGKRIPEYLDKLAAHLLAERDDIVSELTQLSKNIEHIKAIVSVQQSFADAEPLVESVSLVDLMEDALKMDTLSFERRGIIVEKRYDDVPTVRVQKHKVLQILVNLISNAKHAVMCNSGEMRVILEVRMAPPHGVHMIVRDNGMGIARENLTRVFQHGFTTRQSGHGFGLHSGAIAAREIGGSLTVASDGPGHGATFTLALPSALGEAAAQ